MKLFSDFEDFRASFEESIGVQVFSYRTPAKGVHLPYVVILGNGESVMRADNTDYLWGEAIDIHLHSSQPDKSETSKREKDNAEKKIKEFFREAGYPVVLEDTDFDLNTNLFRTQFSVRICYGESDD